MYAQDIRLNFKTTEVYHGFAEVEGMLRIEDQQVVIEYQTKDSVLGVIKSETKSLPIPYSQISEVVFKTNMFRTFLRLQLKSLELLNKFPGSKAGGIKLNLKRKDKEKAIYLQSFIRLRVSEVRLKGLDEGPIPPTKTYDDPFLG